MKILKSMWFTITVLFWPVFAMFTIATMVMITIGLTTQQTTRCNDTMTRVEYIAFGYRAGCWLGETVKVSR